MSLDVVFTYKKLLAFAWHDCLTVVARFLVNFGNWSLKEIIVDSKYRYFGLARSQGNGGGGLRARGQREELWGLVL